MHYIIYLDIRLLIKYINNKENIEYINNIYTFIYYVWIQFYKKYTLSSTMKQKITMKIKENENKYEN